MCSFCIVPFVRGRERSRPIASIVKEIQTLNDEGYKEVTLLGQNVNSYHDTTTPSSYQPGRAAGFKSMTPPKSGGTTFVELVDRVSSLFPEMRIRFTSPHPKDFPDDLFHLIATRPNVCQSLHIPAQSGSTKVLEAMRRGYSRETYLNLIQRAREVIPDVKLSSDFISGFCGETEEDHQQTLALLREVQFDIGFLFAYSMREKTHAHRNLTDDVPPEVKQRRLSEVIALFHELLAEKLKKEIGKVELVLVDGRAVRTPSTLTGRTSGNLRVFFPDVPVSHRTSNSEGPIGVGDYVAVELMSSTGKSFRGNPLYVTTLQEYAHKSSS